MEDCRRTAKSPSRARNNKSSKSGPWGGEGAGRTNGDDALTAARRLASKGVLCCELDGGGQGGFVDKAF